MVEEREEKVDEREERVRMKSYRAEPLSLPPSSHTISHSPASTSAWLSVKSTQSAARRIPNLKKYTTTLKKHKNLGCRSRRPNLEKSSASLSTRRRKEKCSATRGTIN